MSNLNSVTSNVDDLLDKWMAGAETAIADDSVLDHGITSASADRSFTALNAKSGLGFIPSRKVNLNRHAGPNKRKRETKEANEGAAGFHGAVDDDLEESRISVAKKLTPAKPTTVVPKALLNNGNLGGESKKKGKKQAKEHNLSGENGQKTFADKDKTSSDNKPSNSSSDISIKQKGSKTIDKKVEGTAFADAAAAAAAEDDKKLNKKDQFHQRKKVKTRSKQKNIRKDNRADAFKPGHLVLGNKQYQGRPLTPQTKSVLGLS